jgi:hypothetical protein
VRRRATPGAGRRPQWDHVPHFAAGVRDHVRAYPPGSAIAGGLQSRSPLPGTSSNGGPLPSTGTSTSPGPRV